MRTDTVLQRLSRAILAVLFLLGTAANSEAAEGPLANRNIAILWEKAPAAGRCSVHGGTLKTINIVQGEGEVQDGSFAFASDEETARIELSIVEARVAPGPGGATLSIDETENPFTFFLRDVTSEFPIYLPDFEAIVTTAQDKRDYGEIEQAILARGGKTVVERYATEPEESWENAAIHARHLSLPVWLGIGRDYRMFEIDTQYNNLMPNTWITDRIVTRFFGEAEQQFPFILGKGVNFAETMHRWLDNGSLPILHGERLQEEVEYRFTTFATLERSPLTMKHVRGTHYLVAEYSVGGNTRVAMTDEQQGLARALMPEETNPDLEQTVLYFRARARNIGRAPHYAYFLVPNPDTRLDDERGFYLDRSGERVSVVARFNGRPLPNQEISVLLQPGEVATLECRIPHQPITSERAVRLAEQDFDSRLAECRDFWQGKLRDGARIEVPENRIDDMIQAGLLHLDLLCFGREPDEPVGPSCGYGPIGNESAPIIQFLDAMGRHELAERAIEYFLEKQHEDGFIVGYAASGVVFFQGEVGAVLWTIGEHFRYTRDEDWVRRIAPRVLKSCDYLIRKRHEEDDLPRGTGRGMIRGNMIDFVSPNPEFTLNGYACMGLQRIAEMLKDIDPVNSQRLEQEAEAFSQDIRDSFFAAVANSPVVPLGNGSWAPSAPPYAGTAGALALFAPPSQAHHYSHGSALVRDFLVGPLYLVFTEILSPEEPAARWLSEAQSELYCVRNVTPTMTGYSRHPWLQLKYGQVGAFLKAYYNIATSTFDRETYTVKEHPFGGADYKTHEEAWFLMQTRWMLWMEEGPLLKLLAGIPRDWMRSGKRIVLKNVASYFGPVSLQVESRLDEGVIVAEVVCASDRRPESVLIRLPHPEGIEAVEVTGGQYDPQTETVRVEPFNGQTRVELKF